MCDRANEPGFIGNIPVIKKNLMFSRKNRYAAKKEGVFKIRKVFSKKRRCFSKKEAVFQKNPHEVHDKTFAAQIKQPLNLG